MESTGEHPWIPKERETTVLDKSLWQKEYWRQDIGDILHESREQIVPEMANTRNPIGSSKELFGQVSPECKFVHRAAISAYIDRLVIDVKTALEALHCKPKLDRVLMIVLISFKSSKAGRAVIVLMLRNRTTMP
jgi:hypothetical protein